MNREKLIKSAKGYNQDGDCFVYTTMKGGKNCETILAGDTKAILYGIHAELYRLSQVSGNPFETIMQLIHEIHDLEQRRDHDGRYDA